MSMSGIKAVIFDLGNVLVDFDHMIAARRIMQFTAKSPEEIYRLFFDSGITGVFEEGKIDPGEFFAEVKNMLNLSIGFSEFLPIWNEIFVISEKNRKVQELARSLKKRHTIAVLSNINVLHLDYIKTQFRVFDIFDYVFASCDLKTKKPEAGIYNMALNALSLRAEEVFYTDDRPELIESACKLGLKSFVFKSPEKLTQDLLSCGIITGNHINAA